VLRSLFETARAAVGVTVPPVSPADIVLGGLPPVCLAPQVQSALWFKGYEQTYLERDVRALARIGDLVAFRTLLHLAALRTGQVLSIADIARDAKLSAATAGRHLGLLEASFVLHRLPPYLMNRASRLIKAPKIYIGDSGLATHLTGFNPGRGAAAEPRYGALLETYVANNLAGIVDAEWPQARLSFWHVQGRHEVDFVIEVGNECLAVEVKAAGRWDERDLAGLRAFLARTPGCRAAILACGGDSTVQLADRLWAMPIAHLLA
jgi:predicted AAA+ superfamily ATPase